MDYYVDAAVEKIWNMNPVESKGISPEQWLAEQAESTTVEERGLSRPPPLFFSVRYFSLSRASISRGILL
jgi:hypothetical protein